MPAPPVALQTAIRDGLAIRHVFFNMDHSGGNVRAWDGIGQRDFEGVVYEGIHDAARISGLGQSADLRTSDVFCVLNGVPYEYMGNIDASVRGKTATIYFVWIHALTNEVIGSKILFKGSADNMRVSRKADTMSLMIKLKNPVADWMQAPAALWTPEDQARIYPGDTGFSFVSAMENHVVTGWASTTEIVAGNVTFTSWLHASNRAFDDVVMKGGVGNQVIGLQTFNMALLVSQTAPKDFLFKAQAPGNADLYLIENDSGARVNSANGLSPPTIGGNELLIDANGFVRSAGGKTVGLPVSGAPLEVVQALVLQAPINSPGTYRAAYTVGIDPSGEGVSVNFSNQKIFPNDGSYRPDFKVYDNATGHRARISGGGVFERQDNVQYVEANTLSPVGVVGGFLRVAGSNCTLSSTGAVISVNGNYVVKSGGLPANFLRVFNPGLFSG